METPSLTYVGLLQPSLWETPGQASSAPVGHFKPPPPKTQWGLSSSPGPQLHTSQQAGQVGRSPPGLGTNGATGQGALWG